MMNKLNQYINSLPIELQIIINEFNIDRPKMNKVFKELMDPCIKIACEECGITKNPMYFSSRSYKHFICSRKCNIIYNAPWNREHHPRYINEWYYGGIQDVNDEIRIKYKTI